MRAFFSAGRASRRSRISVAVPILFAATAGLWGVMVTDMIQFCITMTSAFAAAYFAVHAPGVGGLHGLIAHLSASHPSTLSILPNFRDWRASAAIFVIPITVLWWSVWYPGAEPGGGSYVAQRMLAARSESDALFGTFAFQVMHYALRPWPWIVVALASTIVYPTLHDIHVRFPAVAPSLIGNDIAYPAMLVFLPPGFAGFMVAGIFAAYRSTIETHLNWGTSYLVHDFYQRFIRPESSERELVFAGRLVTVLLMVLGVLFTMLLDNAHDAFNLLLSIGAGTGLIYLLRWFWWRINAWSEVSAMLASFVVSLGFLAAARFGLAADTTTTLLTTIVVTTAVWIAVTYLTPPVEIGVLAEFYCKSAARRAGVGARSTPLWPPRFARLALPGACRLGIGARLRLRRPLCCGRLRLRTPDPRHPLESGRSRGSRRPARNGTASLERRGRPGARGKLSSTGSNELEESKGAVESAGHPRCLRHFAVGRIARAGEDPSRSRSSGRCPASAPAQSDRRRSEDHLASPSPDT